MGGQRLVLVARVSASVAFFHAGCHLVRTTARCAVETRKWRSETAPFSAAMKGRGEGTSPRVTKKSGGPFFKSPRLVRNTWPFVQNSPLLGACLQRADERSLPVFHTPRGGKSPRAGCLAFPLPTNLQPPIKPSREDYFFVKWGRGGRKKDFPRALVIKCDA